MNRGDVRLWTLDRSHTLYVPEEVCRVLCGWIGRPSRAFPPLNPYVIVSHHTASIILPRGTLEGRPRDGGGILPPEAPSPPGGVKGTRRATWRRKGGLTGAPVGRAPERHGADGRPKPPLGRPPNGSEASVQEFTTYASQPPFGAGHPSLSQRLKPGLRFLHDPLPAGVCRGLPHD